MVASYTTTAYPGPIGAPDRKIVNTGVIRSTLLPRPQQDCYQREHWKEPEHRRGYWIARFRGRWHTCVMPLDRSFLNARRIGRKPKAAGCGED